MSAEPASPQAPTPLLPLSTAEAARACNVSETTLRRALKAASSMHTNGRMIHFQVRETRLLAWRDRSRPRAPWRFVIAAAHIDDVVGVLDALHPSAHARILEYRSHLGTATEEVPRPRRPWWRFWQGA